jgi:hypothetical protein
VLRLWLEGDRRLDVDVARDVALQVQLEGQQLHAQSAMSEPMETEVLRVIQRAQKALVRQYQIRQTVARNSGHPTGDLLYLNWGR